MLSARVTGFTLILAIHVSSTRGGLGLSGQPPFTPQDSPWPAIRAKGNDLYAKGDRRQALSIYEDAAREAEDKRAFQWAGRFLNNAAGCRLAMFEYRKAIDAFLEAQRLARLAGDATVVFGISINLSSLYLQLGDVKMAIEAASSGLEAAGGRLGPEIRLQYLMQLGNIEANQRRFDSAIKYYTSAVP